MKTLSKEERKKACLYLKAIVRIVGEKETMRFLGISPRSLRRYLSGERGVPYNLFGMITRASALNRHGGEKAMRDFIEKYPVTSENSHNDDEDDTALSQDRAPATHTPSATLHLNVARHDAQQDVRSETAIASTSPEKPEPRKSSLGSALLGLIEDDKPAFSLDNQSRSARLLKGIPVSLPSEDDGDFDDHEDTSSAATDVTAPVAEEEAPLPEEATAPVAPIVAELEVKTVAAEETPAATAEKTPAVEDVLPVEVESPVSAETSVVEDKVKERQEEFNKLVADRMTEIRAQQEVTPPDASDHVCPVIALAESLPEGATANSTPSSDETPDAHEVRPEPLEAETDPLLDLLSMSCEDEDDEDLPPEAPFEGDEYPLPEDEKDDARSTSQRSFADELRDTFMLFPSGDEGDINNAKYSGIAGERNALMQQKRFLIDSSEDGEIIFRDSHFPCVVFTATWMEKEDEEDGIVCAIAVNASLMDELNHGCSNGRPPTRLVISAVAMLVPEKAEWEQKIASIYELGIRPEVIDDFIDVALAPLTTSVSKWMAAVPEAIAHGKHMQSAIAAVHVERVLALDAIRAETLTLMTKGAYCEQGDVFTNKIANRIRKAVRDDA